MKYDIKKGSPQQRISNAKAFLAESDCNNEQLRIEAFTGKLFILATGGNTTLDHALEQARRNNTLKLNTDIKSLISTISSAAEAADKVLIDAMNLSFQLNSGELEILFNSAHQAKYFKNAAKVAEAAFIPNPLATAPLAEFRGDRCRINLQRLTTVNEPAAIVQISGAIKSENGESYSELYMIDCNLLAELTTGEETALAIVPISKKDSILDSISSKAKQAATAVGTAAEQAYESATEGLQKLKNLSFFKATSKKEAVRSKEQQEGFYRSLE